jgi:hypothetical protein
MRLVALAAIAGCIAVGHADCVVNLTTMATGYVPDFTAYGVTPPCNGTISSGDTCVIKCDPTVYAPNDDTLTCNGSSGTLSTPSSACVTASTASCHPRSFCPRETIKCRDSMCPTPLATTTTTPWQGIRDAVDGKDMSDAEILAAAAALAGTLVAAGIVIQKTIPIGACCEGKCPACCYNDDVVTYHFIGPEGQVLAADAAVYNAFQAEGGVVVKNEGE